jgi:hypothetical protein
MEKSIILRSEDFKFPSQPEREAANKDYPFFKNFDFAYIHGFKSILVDRLPAEEASRKENLYWWDLCLQNRFGFLYETYLNLITNYNRGFPEDFNKCSDNQHINKILFDYFSEIFYYYFISIRDIIGQILNLYFKLGRTENNSFTQEKFLTEMSIHDGGLFNSFIESTKSAKEIRNSFTHRFTPNQPDYRSSFDKEKNKDIFKMGSGKYISSEKIVENIKDSLQKLNATLTGLKKIMIDNK